MLATSSSNLPAGERADDTGFEPCWTEPMPPCPTGSRAVFPAGTVEEGFGFLVLYSLVAWVPVPACTGSLLGKESTMLLSEADELRIYLPLALAVKYFIIMGFSRVSARNMSKSGPKPNRDRENSQEILNLFHAVGRASNFPMSVSCLRVCTKRCSNEGAQTQDREHERGRYKRSKIGDSQ